MLDDLSPAVERALAAARERAGGGPLNAIHLTLALIADDEGRAARVLIEAGGQLESIRQLLEAHSALAFDFPPVLTGARDVAGERAESTVTGEFLLLGLIQAVEPLREPLRLGGVRIAELIRAAELPIIPLDEPLDLRDPTEYVSAARAFDANANRAREALRVLDDYCRFVLDDAILTQEVKSARHDLVTVLGRVPADVLSESRDTLGDVGTSITAGSEMIRRSPVEVATVNLKRLQESLRSLEEFGKLLGPDLGAGFEAIRYRTYTIERVLQIGNAARDRLHNARLYVLISGSACTAALDWTIREAASGGADIFQLREKGLSDRDLIGRARDVRRWTRESRTLFVVNDRPDIARLVEADGVHLGQDDLSVKDARRVLGPGPLIGVSTHNGEQVRQAVLDGASYIGVGPTFASTTKDFASLAGVEFIRAASELTTLPTFAIGGINETTIGEAVSAGAKRVAVGAAICAADEPALAAQRLRAALR